MILTVGLLALATVKQVTAHGGVQAYSIGGNWYKGFLPYNTPVGQTTIQWEWDTFDPIQDATSSMMSCNDANHSLGSPAQLTATIAAGQPITAYWNPWGHNTGPMMTYLANCGSGGCTNADSSTLNWFKIDEAGLLSGTIFSGYWGDTKMMADNSSWTSTIPSCIPAGNYLIRFETLALHSQPPQFYPECAQLLVTGGGSTIPPNTCKFPGCYSNSDPGIAIDVYSQAAMVTTTYTIPGPPLFTCGGAATTAAITTTTTKALSTTTTTSTKAVIPSTSTTKSSTTTTTKSAATTPLTTKAVTSTTTTKTATTFTAGIATQTHYGQCGGQGYTGPTVCAPPYTCQTSSIYYSQCL